MGPQYRENCHSRGRPENSCSPCSTACSMRKWKIKREKLDHFRIFSQIFAHVCRYSIDSTNQRVLSGKFSQKTGFLPSRPLVKIMFAHSQLLIPTEQTAKYHPGRNITFLSPKKVQHINHIWHSHWSSPRTLLEVFLHVVFRVEQHIRALHWV